MKIPSQLCKAGRYANATEAGARAAWSSESLSLAAEFVASARDCPKSTSPGFGIWPTITVILRSRRNPCQTVRFGGFRFFQQLSLATHRLESRLRQTKQNLMALTGHRIGQAEYSKSRIRKVQRLRRKALAQTARHLCSEQCCRRRTLRPVQEAARHRFKAANRLLVRAHSKCRAKTTFLKIYF